MTPEPPQNGGYMIAAYTIAAIIYLAYTIGLWRRAGRELERIDADVRKPRAE